jgi:hypothetical protein
MRSACVSDSNAGQYLAGCAPILECGGSPPLFFEPQLQLHILSFPLSRSRSLRGEFTFPARNHNARDTIPENGYCSPPHIHELIDREKKK